MAADSQYGWVCSHGPKGFTVALTRCANEDEAAELREIASFAAKYRRFPTGINGKTPHQLFPGLSARLVGRE